MLTFALAVLAASLVGSVHCAGMCGAFTCLYAGTTPRPGGRGGQAALHAAYNAGRLVSYITLGMISGSIGVAIGQGAALVAGVLLVAWGASEIVRVRGSRLRLARVPGPWQRVIGSVVRRVHGRSPLIRATVTGLVTTLLPCGWMWAFVTLAGGTGSLISAAVIMTAFWVGTLPMMLVIGAGAQRLTGRFRAQLPVVSATALVLLGLASIALHLGVLPGSGLLHELVPQVPGRAESSHAGGAH